MNTGSKDKPRRLNRDDILLWLTVLIVFTALEILFVPGALQPLLSLALGALLLGIFWRKKLVTWYAVCGLVVLTGAFTLVNLGFISLQFSAGRVDETSFRGLIQTAAVNSLGRPGLLYTTGLYTMLHLVCRPPSPEEHRKFSCCHQHEGDQQRNNADIQVICPSVENEESVMFPNIIHV